MTNCTCKTRYCRRRTFHTKNPTYYKKGSINTDNRKHNPYDGSGSMYDESGSHSIDRYGIEKGEK